MAALTIEERVAWVHRAATTLQADDLVELKHSLNSLLHEATVLHDLARDELQAHRRELDLQNTELPA